MFDSLEQLFDAIADMQYVVLRNYEEFQTMGFLQDHPDIDFLCENREQMVEQLQLKPRRRKNDGIHYYVEIAGNRVSVDLRTVGDGYLDAAWEKGILQRRVNHDNYYVLQSEDYFYSLLYHVIVQKHAVAEDYKVRLAAMSKNLGIPFRIEDKEQCLDAYMRKQGYHYTYPEFAGTIFHIENVDASLVEQAFGKKVRRAFYQKVRRLLRKG